MQHHVLAARFLFAGQIEIVAVAGHAERFKHAAPALRLVFVALPAREVRIVEDATTGEGHHSLGVGFQQNAMALRPAAVQVDRDVGAAQVWCHRRQRPGTGNGVNDSGHTRQRCKLRRRGQNALVMRKRARQSAKCRHRGQEVAETERAQHQQTRAARRGFDHDARTATRCAPSSAL